MKGLEMKIGDIQCGPVGRNEILVGTHTFTTKQAKELGWWLIEMGLRIEAHERAQEGPDYKDLDEYLKANPPSDYFQPCAFYNVDGNQLEIYWKNAADYGSQVENGSMCIHRNMDTHEAVGVTLYNIKKIMTDES
jgi:hypothetical protein